MNTGIQDAINLGWKLAAAFNQLVLGRSVPRRILRRVAISALLNIRPTRRMMQGRLSGIGIRYPRPRGAHPLTGRRMPDVDCSGTRLYALMRDGRFVLLTRLRLDLGRSDVTVAVHADSTLPPAVLVRPDGYVAWAGEMAEAGAAVVDWLRSQSSKRVS